MDPSNSLAVQLKKTSDQRLGANSKNPFLINFTPNLLLFAFFHFFRTKNAENDYFDQRLACAAPKGWSKYTTLCHPLQ